MLIQYDPDQMRKSASDCLLLSDKITFSYKKNYAEISEHSSGKVANKTCELIDKTEEQSNECKLLISSTASFISKMADYLEEQDKKIAQKIGE